MTDKLTNILTALDKNDAEFNNKLNQNFVEIKTKVGLMFTPVDNVEFDDWKAAGEGTSYQDVNDPSKQIPENCVGTISARAFKKIEVPSPQSRGVTYTHMVFQQRVENTRESIIKCKMAAECGVVLTAHTDLQKLITDPQSGKTYLCILLAAVTSTPTDSLVYDVLLL